MADKGNDAETVLTAERLRKVLDRGVPELIASQCVCCPFCRHKSAGQVCNMCEEDDHFEPLSGLDPDSDEFKNRMDAHLKKVHSQ